MKGKAPAYCMATAMVSLLIAFGTAVAEDCLAPSAWFPASGQTPEPDYTVKPNPKLDCDFYNCTLRKNLSFQTPKTTVLGVIGEENQAWLTNGSGQWPAPCTR